MSEKYKIGTLIFTAAEVLNLACVTPEARHFFDSENSGVAPISKSITDRVLGLEVGYRNQNSFSDDGTFPVFQEYIKKSLFGAFNPSSLLVRDNVSGVWHSPNTTKELIGASVNETVEVSLAVIVSAIAMFIGAALKKDDEDGPEIIFEGGVDL